jgi:hypothetical protein
MQWAQAHKLLAATGAASAPVASLQILQQRNPLFELLQILIHRDLGSKEFQKLSRCDRK